MSERRWLYCQFAIKGTWDFIRSHILLEVFLIVITPVAKAIIESAASGVTFVRTIENAGIWGNLMASTITIAVGLGITVIWNWLYKAPRFYDSMDLGDAIRYMQDKAGLGFPIGFFDIFVIIRTFAVDGRIVIMGREKNPYAAKASSIPLPIKQSSLADCTYREYGDLGHWVLVETTQTQQAEWKPGDSMDKLYDSFMPPLPPTVYYFPTVSRKVLRQLCKKGNLLPRT